MGDTGLDVDLVRRTADQRGRFFLQHLRPGMRVLDCGCGPGSVTIGLAQAVGHGEAVGVDIEARQVDAARALSRQRGIANAQFQTASVYKLPFADKSFDAVFSQALLVHLAEPVEALKEMRRVLRPGGFAGIVDADFGFAIVAPPSAAIDRLMSLLTRGMAFHGGNPFYARQLRPMLHQAGFEPTEGGAEFYSFGSGDAAGRQAVEQLRIRFQGPIQRTVIEQQWSTEHEIDALYTDLDTWSQQPDTFVAFVLCWGLGWMP
jgi:ubiquinone/menaquinone biosynthesis C-methylase UbiE